MKRIVVALALAATACATPSTAPSPASGPFATPLALGDWETANERDTLAAFEREVASRYGAGVEISAAIEDLGSAEFECAAPTSESEGALPAQVCRRTRTANDCTHTWQAHLFEEGESDHIARTRGLYDRRCGNEGLLGGPG